MGNSFRIASAGAGGQLGGRAGGDGHDGQGRVGAALGGQHAAVGDVEVGDREAAAVAVDHAVPLVGGHPGAADQVGVAVDGDDLVGPGGVQDLLHDPLGGAHEAGVVVALGGGKDCGGQAVPGLLLSPGDPAGGLCQQLAQ